MSYDRAGYGGSSRHPGRRVADVAADVGVLADTCDDDLAFSKPWGFDVDEIDVPVLVLQGGMDLMVPFAHGEWLAARSDRITPWLSPEEGHLSMDSKLAHVFDWLMGKH